MSGDPTAMRGSREVRSPSSCMITYMCAKTSSINRLPQEQGLPYSGEGSGERLLRTRMLHFSHGRNRVERSLIISGADCTQSLPHAGHSIDTLLNYLIGNCEVIGVK